MKTNKFNIHWQITRVNAKSLKDVRQKVDYVMDFLYSNKNIHNYNRVMNWLKMTSIAYTDKHWFSVAIDKLEEDRAKFSSTEDTSNNLSLVNINEIIKVRNDLSKRKYGFQFKSVPKDHIEFMEKLEDEISKRK